MNKKADEKVLSVYWIIIIVIITVTIIAGFIIHYSKHKDVREIEAEIIADKIIDCLVNQGAIILKPEKVFSECNLNFQDTLFEGEQYYIEVELSNLDRSKIIDKKTYGDANFKEILSLQQKNFKAAEKYVYVLNEKNEQNLLKILAIVRKTEKNA